MLELEHVRMFGALARAADQAGIAAADYEALGEGVLELFNEAVEQAGIGEQR